MSALLASHATDRVDAQVTALLHEAAEHKAFAKRDLSLGFSQAAARQDAAAARCEAMARLVATRLATICGR